jgi:hypothetical protein
MKIRSMKDVVIPKKPIAPYTGWEYEIGPVLRAYYSYTQTSTCVSPTPEVEIEAWEAAHGIKLAEDMRLFYLEFGPIEINSSLYPVEDFVRLGPQKKFDYFRIMQTESGKLLKELIIFGKSFRNCCLWAFHRDTHNIYYYNRDYSADFHLMFPHFTQFLHCHLIIAQGFAGQETPGIDFECAKIVERWIGRTKKDIWYYEDESYIDYLKSKN